ncbi:MAG: putative baseplate assembly protein [Sideroxyarcus sp.]
MSDPLIGSASAQQEIVQSLLQRLPGYTPEWTLAPGTKGYALIDVLARYQSLLDIGARGLPERNLLALLDTLALPLLPAQAARAPLVFQLNPDCAVDVTLAADSQLAAQLPPPPPSPLAGATAGNQEPVLFFTEQTITIARAKLTTLYSVDPGSDSYADHTASLTDGFTAFGDMARTEHAIYLGHDRLFKLGGYSITLLLQCVMEAASQKPLDIHWQYLSEAGWITLQKAEEDDTTRGLTQDGQIGLRLNCGPDAKKETFNGRTTYWVRGTLNTPVIRGENMRHNPLTINDLRVRVKFKKDNLLPEAAFADGMSLDVSKDFYPFGQQPATFNTFYIASEEVFQRGGARVHIDVTLSIKGEQKNALELQWDYYGNSGWQKLGIEPEAGGANSYNFNSAKDTKVRISFNCPADWLEGQVNGKKNRWLRIRIANGNYGEPTHYTGTTVVASSMVAPVVSKLTLSYTYITDPDVLDHCLTHNDFLFEDHTEDARWPDRSFDPFWPVSDDQPALHFCFDQRLPSGLVSLYVQVPGAEEQVPGSASAFTWEYLSLNGWIQLGVRDETNGLRQSGVVQFIGPPDAVAAPGLGGNSWRIRARLKDGVALADFPVSGLWLNSVWASHRVRIEQEMLGIADGTPRQALRFVYSPVLAGENIEIREWAGSGEGWQLVARQVPEADLRYERDPLSNKITVAWVRWRERPHLYDAQEGDRVFVLERATGLIRFGNGTQGMIPPAGSRVVANYLSGGGLIGNVQRDTITQLRSAVPFVANVSNPVAAAGGADGELLAALGKRGPQHLRHRDRAITAADIEWIARDASPEVARARCLAITGPAGHAQRGWITVIVVPLSGESRPWPSAELQRRVAEYLRARVPATVVRRLQVVEPNYIALNVSAEIVPVDPNAASMVEARLRENLNRFLHPLTGGPAGNGWGFGEAAHLSNIAAVIEDTDGVDYARDIRLFVDGGERGQSIEVPRDALLCAGAHEIKLAVGVR